MAAKEGGNWFDGAFGDYFAVLGEEHRDAVVEILADEGSSVGLSELAERVAAETRGVSLDGLPASDVERVELSLHHNHLPKLDEAGVVAYASGEKHVAPTDDTEAADDLVGSDHPFSTV
ncbi:DUF7344 domain-containing protein [Halopelagius longus]|uniref:DUF7344 domain-containing protein n=1 Tax=Halopelagius longus TaxID=1236180 RepID=A0A1H0YTM2_9EURY|nr:hypothetical protein [Halopelagius longus]RDI72672.1 hypothetical protein DWB78_13590 [Halopelagius longus]SDQ18524.1 hypothetical protein SAMN05216278_0837 [Halopelagius longus]